MAAETFPLQWPEGWPRTSPYKRGPSRFGKNLGFNQITKLQNELRLLCLGTCHRKGRQKARGE